jgi:hypothetical protein
LGNKTIWLVALFSGKTLLVVIMTDYLQSIQQTTDGGYILGGILDSGISGDKTEAMQGGDYTYDYWVVKLSRIKFTLF